VSKNTVINGFAIGFGPIAWRGAPTLSINGVSVSASPIDPFLAAAVLVFSYDRHKSDSLHPRETVGGRGYYIKATDTVKDHFNGLILGSFTGGAKSNGINISAIMNNSYSMNGLSIAGLRNKTTKGRGLQIGLLNRCKEGKLVQIGLLNKIGKRTIPFINFQF
jgi:hypothetical protein